MPPPSREHPRLPADKRHLGDVKKHNPADACQKGSCSPAPYVALDAMTVAEPECGEATIMMQDSMQGTDGDSLLEESRALLPKDQRVPVLHRMIPQYCRALGHRLV